MLSRLTQEWTGRQSLYHWQLESIDPPDGRTRETRWGADRCLGGKAMNENAGMPAVDDRLQSRRKPERFIETAFCLPRFAEKIPAGHGGHAVMMESNSRGGEPEPGRRRTTGLRQSITDPPDGLGGDLTISGYWRRGSDRDVGRASEQSRPNYYFQPIGPTDFYKIEVQALNSGAPWRPRLHRHVGR